VQQRYQLSKTLKLAPHSSASLFWVAITGRVQGTFWILALCLFKGYGHLKILRRHESGNFQLATRFIQQMPLHV
jgi:hypothetical protein